jgi:hypothetical protein
MSLRCCHSGRASGWTTVNLAPGRYGLICDITGHYRIDPSRRTVEDE